MKINFVGRMLQIDDARIIYRNFQGRGDKYNREGDRNFSVLIPDEEIANALVNEGWNVKVKPPREEGDAPFMYLPVKIKYTDKGGPTAYLSSGKAKTVLNVDTIGIIDDIEIMSVNLDIRPYNWEVNGKTGRSAYLQTIEVIQKIDRFADNYVSSNLGDEESPF